MRAVLRKLKKTLDKVFPLCYYVCKKSSDEKIGGGKKKGKTVKRIFYSVAFAIILSAIVFMSAFAFFAGCSGEKQDDVISVVSPENLEEVILDNDEVRDFFDNYTRYYSSKQVGKGDVYFMSDVVLEWTADGAERYVLTVADNENFTSAREIETKEPKAALENLIPFETYYWKVEVVSESGENKTSKVYEFKTSAGARTVRIDGISNTRDIGGLVNEDGKRMKYGLAYCAGAPDEITERGKKQVLQLGIKTQLDLRGFTDVVSSLGAQVEKINANAPWYVKYPNGVYGNAQYIEALRKEIQAFAYEGNYPILFHCVAGRDRTGTLAAIIEGICGVPEDLIVKEYELSFFSVAGTAGLTPDRVKGFVDALDATVYKIKKEEKKPTFRECAISFAMNLGVSAEEIASIQNILLN